MITPNATDSRELREYVFLVVFCQRIWSDLMISDARRDRRSDSGTDSFCVLVRKSKFSGYFLRA